MLKENELKKLQTFRSSYFRGKSHFVEDNITQKCWSFQPMYKYFQKIGNTNHISKWKSKGLSDEIIKRSTTSNNTLGPGLSYFGAKIKVKFDGSCLKQDKITCTHATILNIYIVYELSSNLNCNKNITLENCLFVLLN